MNFYLQTCRSPVGLLYLVASEKKLRVVIFANGWNKVKDDFPEIDRRETPLLKQTKKQLDEYFRGRRKTFNLPLELSGTHFQKQVWNALKSIPFGKTKTYKQQAEFIGSPKAVRAVGRTNGLNRLCIVLPCHRVIGSDGSLTGFGGGLEKKKYLLDFEGAKLLLRKKRGRSR